MSNIVQYSLWEIEPSEQPKYYTRGDEIEVATGWADGDTSPDQLQRLASIIRRQKYEVADMTDVATGKKRSELVLVKGVRVENNRVYFWGTLIEARSIYGGRAKTEDEEEDEYYD